MATAEPKPTDSLAAQATRRIKEAILNGELLPDSPLIESQLCERLGMSKTPIREALRTLSSSGFITVGGFRTLQVRRLSEDDVADILEVRIALEPLAIEKACRLKASGRDQNIRDLMEKAKTLTDSNHGDELVVTNRELHAELVKDCGNDEILQILYGYNERLKLAVVQGWNRSHDRDRETDEHQAIVEAFLAGESQLASRLMKQHIIELFPTMSERHPNRSL